jgi:hypothetical protein
MAYPNYYNGGYYPQYQNGAVPDMLNQFKGQYQQPMQMVQPMQTMTPTNDVLWVLNENEATSYPVAVNNSVVLWDKNKPTIYVKSVNAQGVPSMRVLDFTERNADVSNSLENSPKKHECKCGDKFVTKEEFDALKGKFYVLQARYDEMLLEVDKKEEKPKTTTKKTKESEE